MKVDQGQPPQPAHAAATELVVGIDPDDDLAGERQAQAQAQALAWLA